MSDRDISAPKCDLMIDDATVVLPTMEVKDSFNIAVHKGRIVAVGPANELRDSFAPESVLDGSGKIAIPGLIDAHTHLAQQLLRGGVIDEPPIVWQRILVPFENRLSPEDLYVGARLGCVQMAKSGITCFADSGTAEMEPIITAAIETGMRANIARMSRDRGEFIPERFKDRASVVIRKTEQLHRSFHGAANGRIQVAFSATSLQTASPELLEGVAAAAKRYKTVLHIHLAEHLKEVQQCLTEFGVRPVEYLQRHGALGPNLLGAHSVQLSDREICLLSEHDAKPVHCPASNLRSHGFPKTPTMLALGLRIGMGTDGASATDLDLFALMRLLKLTINARFGLPVFDSTTIPIQTLFEMPTINGAAALQLEDEVGSIEPGKKADIVLLRWNEVQFTPAQRPFPMLVIVACARDVCDTIIDGRVVVKDGKHQLVDEAQVIAKASERMRVLMDVR
jgi:5-methylthioadenosine/S-adenosylhomocysteine deaminase